MNKLLKIGETTLPLSAWAKLRDVPYNTVAMRWARGHRDPKKLLHRRVAPVPMPIGEELAAVNLALEKLDFTP